MAVPPSAPFLLVGGRPGSPDRSRDADHCLSRPHVSRMERSRGYPWGRLRRMRVPRLVGDAASQTWTAPRAAAPWRRAGGATELAHNAHTPVIHVLATPS